MILNPLLSIRTFEDEQGIQNIQTAAPKKGSTIKIESFYKQKNKELFQAVVSIIENCKCIKDISEKNLENLNKAQILIGETETSTYKTFVCSVDEKLQLNPFRCLKNLILNPYIFNSSIHCPPMEVVKRMQNTRIDLAFSESAHGTTWVKDYITEAWWPYSLSLNLINTIKYITADPNYIKNISDSLKTLLAEIKVLIPENYKEVKAHKIKKYQNIYTKKGSIQFKQVVSEPIRRALYTYLVNLENEGFLRLGDFQSSTRYWAHNEVVNRFVQSQLSQFVSEVAQECWVPAFSYYVAYKEGSSLKKHLDRSQASLSLSLLIEYGDENNYLEDEWPLFVETDPGSDKYYKYIIGKGNAGLFEGNKYVHYRLKIPKGHYSMNMLFHFVRSNFEGKVM